MQRRDTEMARTRKGERRLHRLAVTYLSYYDDVRCLAHRALQRPRIGLGVQAEFALVDDGLLVRMQELDRVLDGDDVLLVPLVDAIEHARDRRRLT